MDWSDYFNAAKEMGPNPFYSVMERYLPDVPGRVVELGFGVGTGLGWWLDRGWSVLGIDEDARMCEYARATHSGRKGLEVVQAGFCDVDWNNPDVICAVFALFFAGQSEYWKTWDRVRLEVENGAIFGGQLIGPEDDWAEVGVAVTREELDRMVLGLNVRHWEEVRRGGKTVYGVEKEWHVYHLVIGPG